MEFFFIIIYISIIILEFIFVIDILTELISGTKILSDKNLNILTCIIMFLMIIHYFKILLSHVKNEKKIKKNY